jgi:hypothetical protein
MKTFNFFFLKFIYFVQPYNFFNCSNHNSFFLARDGKCRGGGGGGGGSNEGCWEEEEEERDGKLCK